MIKLKPQFIKDTAGKQLVILSKKEYDAIIDELEEAEDVRLYDEAKKSEDSFVPIEKAFKIVEKNRKKRQAHAI